MTDAPLNFQVLQEISRVFKALCDPVRLQILQELKSGEKSVSELIKCLELPQSTLSKQLKTLCEAQLLQRKPQGNMVYYSISDPMVYELCETVCQKIEKRLGEQIKIYSSLAALSSKKQKRLQQAISRGKK